MNNSLYFINTENGRIFIIVRSIGHQEVKVNPTNYLKIYHNISNPTENDIQKLINALRNESVFLDTIQDCE